MSKTEAEGFLAKMLGDEAFRDAVIQIEDVKKKIEFLNGAGFFFTSDELEDASESMPLYAIIWTLPMMVRASINGALLFDYLYSAGNHTSHHTENIPCYSDGTWKICWWCLFTIKFQFLQKSPFYYFLIRRIFVKL